MMVTMTEMVNAKLVKKRFASARKRRRAPLFLIELVNTDMYARVIARTFLATPMIPILTPSGI